MSDVLPDLLDDDQLSAARARVGNIVHGMLDEVEKVLLNGTAAQKQALITKILPTILKDRQEDKEDQEKAELRALLAQQNEAIQKILLSTPATATPAHVVQLPAADDPS